MSMGHSSSEWATTTAVVCESVAHFLLKGRVASTVLLSRPRREAPPAWPRCPSERTQIKALGSSPTRRTPIAPSLVRCPPGFYVVHAFNRVVALPGVNFWIEMLAVLLVNMGIYFAIGYVLDFAINRRRTRKLPSPLTSGDIE